MAKKRRPTELFSISFLDCICCGFGAMLLLFVLLIGRKTDSVDVGMIQRTNAEISSKTETLKSVNGDLRDKTRIADERITVEIANREVLKFNVTKEQDEYALLLQNNSILTDQNKRLIATKENVPKTDETVPLPIPNTLRRQYLTGFNFEGNYVVFMIEASGGMLGYTIEEAIAKSSLPDADKRKVEKWRRVVRSLHWVIANLGPKQVYQVVIFNEEAKPLIPERELDWFESLDRDSTAEVLKRLENVTPNGPANLELAFLTVREKFPSVDSIVLLTDSLPTQSVSVPVPSITNDRDRERFFRAAIKEAPRQTPINTILYPMSGDPAAAYLFWQLADSTRGSLISPAPSWPDI